MPDFSFPLSQSVSFTGTSIGTNSQGAYTPLLSAGVPLGVSYSHGGGALQIQFFDFNFDYSTGYSTMGMDLVLLINGVQQNPSQRFLSETRSKPDLLRFGWSTPSLPAGILNLGVGVRSVLQNGPPCPIQVTGNATLRLTTSSKTLTVQPPGSHVVNAGSSFNVVVQMNAAQPSAVSVHLDSKNGFLRIDPASQVITPGQTSAMFWIFGQVGGNDFVTPSASGFDSVPFPVTVKPVLTALNPASGAAGTVVEFVGNGFAPGADVVFGHSAVKATAFKSVTSLSAPIPAGSPVNQPLSIAVEVNGQSSSPDLNFQVTPAVLPPVVTGFTPPSGPVGTRVTITGTGLSGVTGVAFGKGSVTPLTTSETAVTVIVPLDSVDGKITVTKGSFPPASTAGSFDVLPQITAVTPGAALIGAAVTVTGNHFENVTKLTFGGANSPVASGLTINALHTAIATTVPPGAKDGLIAVWIGATPFFSPSSFNALTDPAVLTLTNLAIDVTPVLFQKNFNILVSCKNSGELPSGPFTIRVHIASLDVSTPNSVWGPVTSPEVTGLTANATHDFTFPVTNLLPTQIHFQILAELIVNGVVKATKPQNFIVE